MKRIALIIVTISLALAFISCASTAVIKFEGNQSVGDSWESAITPEGIVREVSNKYRIFLPFPGMGGTFTFKFEAIAQGEAEIVLTHYFRGRKTSAVTYNAVVDNRRRLTLTKTGSTAVDMKDDLLGTWYDADTKTAIKFFEDLVQTAVNVENIETAHFVDIGTYTAGWNFIDLTITHELPNGDLDSYTERMGYTFYKGYNNNETYLSLSMDNGFSGSFTKQ